MILIQRVSSSLSSAILTIIVSGIESSMPTGPKIHPQKTKDKKTTKGDRLRPLPINLGSSKLPIKMFIIR
jgi:hypothetical protein